MHSQCLRFICVWFVTSMFDQDKKPCSVTSVTDDRWFQNHAQLPFYVLVPKPLKEAKLLPIQCKMVSEEKLQRAQRKHTRQLQCQLFQLWDKYVAAEITASQLPRKCSNIYSLTHL